MSSQVGSGHIAIFPTMTGFKGKVSREMKSAGASSAKDFETSIKGAGATAGTRLGRDLKGALTSSTGDLGAAAMKGLSREVAAASGALSKARLKQQDEAGKVRVAEARLAEQVAKYGSASSQAIAAEERLATARRSQKVAIDNVSAATARLKGAQDEVAKATSASSSAQTSMWGGLVGKARAGLSGLVDAGRSVGQAMGDAIQSAATASVAGLGAAIAVVGAKTVSTVKAAVTEFATWEQAVGGVETLFKSSAGTVQAYAAEAYKSAGVSANDYMSQVTSFSASLISSLGGDTAAAADLANQAVIDMSDNANKMGTDLSSIQQTYQSLARGNYGMLDNLKLGYGGTKSELERLMSDAEKLSGQKYSVGNFSDVISAIHVVQNELGITGTTALEAATTIEGSVASMKSSWKNWLAELGKDDADIGGMTSRLTESIGVALGNLIPRIGQILKSLVQSIPQLLSGLVSALPKPFQDAVNGVLGVLDQVKAFIAPLGAAFLALGSGGVAGLIAKIPILGSLLGGLTGPLSLLGGPLGIAAAAFAGFALSGGDAGAIVNSLTGIIDSVVAALPGLVSKVATFVPELVSSILSQVPALLEAAVGIVNALVTGLVAAIPILVTGAVSLIDGLIQAIVTNLPMIIDGALQLVTGLLTGIVTALPLIIQAGIQLLLSLVTGLIDALPQLITAAITLVLQLVAGLLTMLPQLIVAGIELIVALITGLVGAIPQIIEMLPQIIGAIWDGLLGVDWLDLGKQIVWGIISGLASMGGDLLEAITDLAASAFDGFKSFFGISSPAKRMKQPGRDVVRGVNAGVDDQAESFGDSLVAMANAGTRRAEAAMTAAVAVSPRVVDASASSSASTLGTGAAPVQVTANFEGLDPEVAIPMLENRLVRVMR